MQPVWPAAQKSLLCIQHTALFVRHFLLRVFACRASEELGWGAVEARLQACKPLRPSGPRFQP